MAFSLSNHLLGLFFILHIIFSLSLSLSPSLFSPPMSLRYFQFCICFSHYNISLFLFLLSFSFSFSPDLTWHWQSDFGLATRFPSEDIVVKKSETVGTRSFMSPETIFDHITGPAGDVWSLAFIHLMMIKQTWVLMTLTLTIFFFRTDPPKSSSNLDLTDWLI